MSTHCLAPQRSLQFAVFPFLPRVFPLLLATLLIIVQFSSTLYGVIEIKNKRVCNGLLFPGNLDPSSLTPGGPVVLWVCGFRRRDKLPAWRELFANLHQLQSRYRTTLSKFIRYIDLTDFCQILPKHFRNYDKRKCVGKF